MFCQRNIAHLMTKYTNWRQFLPVQLKQKHLNLKYRIEADKLFFIFILIEYGCILIFYCIAGTKHCYRCRLTS